MKSFIEQFSCPSPSYNHQLTSEIAISYTSELLGIFLDTQHNSISNTSKGLIEFIQSCREQGFSFEQVWHHTLGGLEAALDGSSNVNASDILARIAIHLASYSVISGQFTCDIVPEKRLVFGEWLLPNAKKLDFCIDGNIVEFSLTSIDNIKRRYIFINGIPQEKYLGITKLHSVEDLIVLLPDKSVQISSKDFKIQESPLEDITESVMNHFQNSLCLLDNGVGHYKKWILDIIRGILCYPEFKSQSFSGSWNNVPGTIHMSLMEDPDVLCSVLVHEASHQYFHLVARLTDFVENTDTKLYFSPPAKTDRPLDRILLAYHAFANIVLFFDACKRANILSYFGMQQLKKCLSHTQKLSKPLEKNPTISSAGNALYKPLRDRVLEISL